VTREQAREFAYIIVGCMMTNNEKYAVEAEDKILALEVNTAKRCAEIADEEAEIEGDRGAVATRVGDFIRHEFGLEPQP
jgi:hypothetical protein